LSSQRPRLRLDENIGLRVYEELKRRGYEVQTVIKELCGASDEEALRIASNLSTYNPPEVLRSLLLQLSTLFPRVI